MSILATNNNILGHVVAIRSSHRRLTGLELPWPDAINLLDRYNAILEDDIPPKVFEVMIGCFLIQESYSPDAIRRIIAYVATFGSAAGSPDLVATDVEALDLLLPSR